MEDTGRQKRASGNIRQRIMEAALKVFGERGYQRATTKAIAAEAGIAEGTIFNYFRTKKDILLGFMEEHVLSPLPDVFGDTSVDDETLIKAFLRNRINVWRANAGALKVVISEAMFDPQMARGFQERVFGPGTELMMQYINKRIEQGIFRRLDPFTVACSLVAYAIGFGLIEQVAGNAETTCVDEKTIDTLTAIFLKGMLNPEKPSGS